MPIAAARCLFSRIDSRAAPNGERTRMNISNRQMPTIPAVKQYSVVEAVSWSGSVIAAREVERRVKGGEEKLRDRGGEEREIKSDRPLRHQAGNKADSRCDEGRRRKTQQDGKVIALEDQGDGVSADTVVSSVRERD